MLVGETAAARGRPTTLDDLPDDLFDRAAARGLSWIWMLGVWQTGLAGQRGARAPASRADLQRESARRPRGRHRRIAVRDRRLRRPSRLRRRSGAGPAARSACTAASLRLLVDFIPNHVALDHPWVDAHPEFFIEGDEDDLRREPKNYVALQTARGRKSLRARPRSELLGLERHAPAQLPARRPARVDDRRARRGSPSAPTASAATWRCCSSRRSSPAPGASARGRATGRRRSTARSGPRPSRASASNTRDSCSSPRPTGTSSGRCRRRDSTSPTTSGSTTACAPATRAPCASTWRPRPRSATARCTFWRTTTSRAPPPPSRPTSTAPPPSTSFLVPGLRFFHEGEFEGRKAHASIHLARRMAEKPDAALGAFYETAAGLSASAGDARGRLAPLRLPRGLERQPDLGQLHRLQLGGSQRGSTAATASCWSRSTTARRAASATRRSRSARPRSGCAGPHGPPRRRPLRARRPYPRARGALSGSARLGIPRLRRPASPSVTTVCIAFISRAGLISLGFARDEGLNDIESLLQKTSRTFALTIPCLPQPTRDEVGIAYLLFRIIDTFEDAVLWPPALRLRGAETVRRPARSTGRGVANARRELDARAAALARGLPGAARPHAVRARAVPRAAPGGAGHLAHARRPQRRGDGQLRRAGCSRGGACSSTPSRIFDAYCYAVAGIVGEMLTELFLLGRPPLVRVAGELRSRAAAFGEGLQLVNILKDARPDAAEGRTFLPRQAPLAEVFALARKDLAAAVRVRRAPAPRGARSPGWSPSTPSSASWRRRTCRSFATRGSAPS